VCVCVFKTLDRYNLSIIGQSQNQYLVATCVRPDGMVWCHHSMVVRNNMSAISIWYKDSYSKEVCNYSRGDLRPDPQEFHQSSG
jgi:hypothetical protein